MKLYAVVIGRKGRNRQYVAYCPFVDDDETLAVYGIKKKAISAKKNILATYGHKDVYVIPFESKP